MNTVFWSQHEIINKQLEIIEDVKGRFTASEILNKVHNLINHAPFGSLNIDFLNYIHANFYKKYNFSDNERLLYFRATIDDYVRTTRTEIRLQRIEAHARTIKPNFIKPLDKNFIKQIYTCKYPEIIEIYKQNYPIPPLSFFEPDCQPPFLVELESTKKATLDRFCLDEKKIIPIQRHIRRKIRMKKEIDRISSFHFNGSKELAMHAIEDANTPYRPKKCSPELAVRIMKAAKQIKLFSSVRHLTSAYYVASILDTCLFGRENLINLYIDFRPAALKWEDVQNGDFNAICFGPNRIDKNCLKEKSFGLKFDLDKLIDNPAIFFKQRDIAYTLDHWSYWNYINLGELTLSFLSTAEWNKSKNAIPFYIRVAKTSNVHFYSEVPNCTLISNNAKDMHQILTLNFFRFIDNLYCCAPINRLANVKTIDTPLENLESATDATETIYNAISKLNDIELINFLSDLGKKMTTTCEFNISGAYQIDLDALLEIEVYNGDIKEKSISISDLEEIKKSAPEFLESKRFSEKFNYLH